MYGISSERLASLARGNKPRNAYEACAAFVARYDQREPWNTPHPVWQSECSGILVLHSYDTPVALFDGDFYVSMVTHSSMTAQHIGKLKRALASEGYRADYGTICGLPRDLAYGWAHAGLPFVRYTSGETMIPETLWQSDNRKWVIVGATGDYAATVRDYGFPVAVVSPYGDTAAIYGDVPQYVRAAARDIIRLPQPVETYPGVPLYKVTDCDNRAHNGGMFAYVSGEWTPPRLASVCVSGYHVTTQPGRWARDNGDRVYRVRVSGEPDTQDDKRAYSSIFLVPGYVTYQDWADYVFDDPASLWESYAHYD